MDDVDSYADEAREQLRQLERSGQICAGGPVAVDLDEEIDVARRLVIAARDGAEDADVSDPPRGERRRLPRGARWSIPPRQLAATTAALAVGPTASARPPDDRVSPSARAGRGRAGSA